MSDQYYYLLDGKEHGPFSRAAIESLLASGSMEEAFVRANPDQPWQAPEELELVATQRSPVQSVQHSNPDPAAVVFRPKHEVKRSNSVGAILAGIGLCMLVGLGIWITAMPPTQHSAQVPGHSSALASTTQSENASFKSDAQMSDAQMAAADAAASAASSTGPVNDTIQKKTSVDVCADLVNDVIGPKPKLNQYIANKMFAASALQACTNLWTSYSYQIRNQCQGMKQIARQDPQDGSLASLGSQKVFWRMRDEAYQMGGKYYMQLNEYCK